MAKIKKLFPLILLTLLTILVIYPLFGDGFIRTDDGNQMVTRAYAFHETLKMGQFPVRFLEKINHGYGYPVMNFLYPLPFYTAEIFHLLGADFISAIKVLFALSVILSAVSMYLWIKNKFQNETAALIAAIVYSFAPYRLFDLYSRGSLGESLAFVFIPLVFLFLDKVQKNKSGLFMVFGAISLAGLITSHNVIAFIFLPLIITYCAKNFLTSSDKKQSVLAIGATLFLGFLLSAFFTIPAIYDLRYTRASQISVSQFQTYFLKSEMFLIMTRLSPLFFFGGAIIWFRKKQADMTIFLAAALIALFLSLEFSLPIWQNSPLPTLVQFPWRFLAIFIFSISFLAGSLFSEVKKTLLVAIVAAAVIIIGLTTYQADKVFYPLSYYTGNDGTTTIKNEYLPIWVKNEFLQLPGSIFTLLKGNGHILSEHQVVATEPMTIRINKVYFPGWKVTVDGKNTPIDYTSEGFLDISLPPGDHRVSWSFNETPLRLLADILSLIGVVVALLFLALSRKFLKSPLHKLK